MKFKGDAEKKRAAEADRKNNSDPNEGLSSLGRDDYLHMQKSYYDERATDLRTAQNMVHPNYDMASRQTTTYLGYVLNDFAERHAAVDGVSAIKDVRQAFQPPRPSRILDFGCGVGRNMVELVQNGFAVDGVDISQEMLAFARRNPLLRDCGLFLSNGNDCGSAPAGEYDLVFSTLCFQHICCRSIRIQILSAIYEALSEGGVVHIQFHFYPTTMAPDVPSPHAPWDADNYSATATNSEADVWVTPDQLGLVWQDFGRFFLDLRFTFIDFPATAIVFRELYPRPFGQVLVSASKGYSIADRIYHVR